ncbi:MAG: hypothetical protein AAFR21_05810 [Pseudomonadota bacterium]
MIKPIFLLIATIVLGAGAAFAEEPKSAMKDKAMAEIKAPRVTAVMVYADWCSSCKILDPNVTKAKEAGAFEGIDYVVLDYTSRDQEAFFGAADEAGVGPAVRAHLADEIKTGWLLLVDNDDARVVGKAVKSMSPEEIAGAVKSASLAS